MKRCAILLSLSLIPATLQAQAPGGHEEPSTQKPASTVNVSVEEAVICTDVVERTPVEPGYVFDTSVGRLYCFTKITGAGGETTVKHIWYRGEKMLHEQVLPVKSTSWRTWSSKKIRPEWKGNWMVEVAAHDGTVLKTLLFELR